MATTRATPTARAAGCLQGFDRPSGWRFDDTGGFHLQRPAPKPTQPPPRPHRRRASIERRVDGRDGQGLRAAARKVPPRRAAKRPERGGTRGTRRPGRCCSSGPSRSGPRSVQPPPRDPRPPCNEPSWGAGGPRSGLLTPSEWDTDMDHWDEPVDDNAGPDFDCFPTTTPYQERVMYYTCLRHTAVLLLLHDAAATR